MKTEKPILAMLAFATLFSLASPRPDDQYRRAAKVAERGSPESQQAVGSRPAWTRSARRRRGYSRWMVGDVQYGGFDNFPPWQPEVIGPAYVIPVYPPSHSNKRPHHNSRHRPFDVNPGIPPDNPIKKPYRGPSYLPPRKPTPTTSEPTPTPTTSEPTPTTNATKIDNRFDDDDRPIWGGSEAAPASGGVPVVPTRPPRPPNMPDVPPLVHLLGGSPMNPLSVNDKEFGEEDAPARPPLPTRTTTSRTTTTTTPTAAPRPAPSIGPTDCVWAVVSCCSAASVDVVETCFEQRGCPGPFWDSGPCESDFARAAVKSALEFYNQ